LNTYGIAYYKLTPRASLEEIELVKALGVEFRCGIEVNRDICAQLEKDFDAIFVGIGLGGASKLNIPGEDLPGVVGALTFIEQIHSLPLHEVPVGRRVAVIGGGNTAIDAATQAKRLGAEKVTLVYRRSQPEMSAYEFEQELAKADGVDILVNTAPVEVLADAEGHAAALKLVRSESRNGNLETLSGTEFVQPFDMVIKAIGEQKQSGLLKKMFPALRLDEHGVVVHDTDTGQTNLPNVFAGGDCANGGREVVNAVAEGKKAARGMHAMFANMKQKITGPVQASRLGVEGGAVGAGYERPIRVGELLKNIQGSTAHIR
jgi:glutamate synthase (NADPH/NADH) small chain